jgi:hypothetical protein
MSILKRQRELKNAEKAARKRAIRHGQPLPGVTEPRPTLLATPPPDEADGPESDSEVGEEQRVEDETTA